MTQPQLIIEYLKEHGSILPAKMAGQIYKETMFGSETSKRCRELRKIGKLRSEGDGRFERFYLTSTHDLLPNVQEFLRNYPSKSAEIKEKTPTAATANTLF
jgi:hypothetical protein